MDELITRMPRMHRINMSELLQHRRIEFSNVIEKRILNYLNRLFERGKIPTAFKEHYDNSLAQEQQKKIFISGLREKTQQTLGSSSNNIVAGVAIAANLAGTAAEKFQEREIQLLEKHEASERLEAAQMSVYVPSNRAPIARFVADILSYRFQFLLLRLNGGNNGYIKLAHFMGDAIEASAIAKLREHKNQIDALVDASIPKSDSIRYNNFLPALSSKGFRKTIEIDPHTNEMIEECGPAVTALLGKVKHTKYYTIIEALNYPYILNARGQLITGSTLHENKHQLFNSKNPFPIILLAPNETTAHIGLEHGTTPTTQTIQTQQLIVLQRLVPDFLTEEVNHSIHSTHYAATENPADMVHLAERKEYKWTLERVALWKERQAAIKLATKGIEPQKNASTKADHHGLISMRTAKLFDANQAFKDVEKMQLETMTTFDKLNALEESDAQANQSINRKLKKEKLNHKILYLVLSVKQLIKATQKLGVDDAQKEHYFNLAIQALKNAKHTMETTRDTPIAEFTKRERSEKLTNDTKKIFKLWQKHLYFCNAALDITTQAVVPLQIPQTILKFVFDRESKNSKKITELMTQAKLKAAHSSLLMEQMAVLIKFSTYNLGTNTFLPLKPTSQSSPKSLQVEQRSSRHIGGLLLVDDDSEEEKSSPLNDEHSLASERSESSSSFSSQALSLDDTPPSSEDNSQSAEFISMIKDAFNDMKVDKKNLVDMQLEKITVYINGIKRFKNGIYASLGIDAIHGGIVYANQQPVELNSSQLKIAIMANTTLQEAEINQTEAIKARKRALMIFPFHKRNIARQQIIDREIQCTKQFQDLIDSLGELERQYQTISNEDQQYSAARILWTYRRFQLITKPSASKENLWGEKISLINKIAQAYEDNMDKHSHKTMLSAYQQMETELMAMGKEKPSTLNEALEYAQIIKNCNRQIIHAANGERAAILSSETLAEQLNHDIKQATNSIDKIKTSLIDLTRNCHTSTNSAVSITQKKIILDNIDAQTEISNFIKQFNAPKASARSKSRLTKCASVTKQEITCDTIQLKLTEKIHALIDLACDSDPKHKPSLLARINDDLIENSQHLPINHQFLNWGVWIISIAARTCIVYHKELLKLPCKQQLPPDSIADKELNLASQSMLTTRKLMLEVYQELNHAMLQASDEYDETLTTNQELVLDELHWASQLSIEEQLAREHLHYKKKPVSIIPSMQTYHHLQKSYKEKDKANPNKSIYFQLLVYSTLSVRNKQNIIQKLNGYRIQLHEDNHYFSDPDHLNATSNTIKKDIQALYLNIEKKITLEKKEKLVITQLEKNLSSRLVMIKIFFQDWRDKTRDAFPTNSLLSALKEASKVRAKQKQKQKQIEEQAQADNETKEEESFEVTPSSIEDLTLENIDDLYRSIQQRITSIKKRPVASEISAAYPTGKSDDDLSGDDERDQTAPQFNRLSHTSLLSQPRKEERAQNYKAFNDPRGSSRSSSQFFREPPSAATKKQSKVQRKEQKKSAPNTAIDYKRK